MFGICSTMQKKQIVFTRVVYLNCVCLSVLFIIHLHLFCIIIIQLFKFMYIPTIGTQEVLHFCSFAGKFPLILRVARVFYCLNLANKQKTKVEVVGCVVSDRIFR